MCVAAGICKRLFYNMKPYITDLAALLFKIGLTRIDADRSLAFICKGNDDSTKLSTLPRQRQAITTKQVKASRGDG